MENFLIICISIIAVIVVLTNYKLVINGDKKKKR